MIEYCPMADIFIKELVVPKPEHFIWINVRVFLNLAQVN